MFSGDPDDFDEGGETTTMANALNIASKAEQVKEMCEKIQKAKSVVVFDYKGLTVAEDEVAAEYENLAKQYELDVEKIKSMVPAAEVEENLKTRKAVKLIVDNAVAVAPKAE